jgi:hypothetical protein
MKLKSFGCSFIYGTDLADCDPAYSKNRFGTGNPDNENKSSKQNAINIMMFMKPK